MASTAELASGASIAHEGLVVPSPRAPVAGGLGSRPSIPGTSESKFLLFWFERVWYPSFLFIRRL
jgi:hypothetical protein